MLSDLEREILIDRISLFPDMGSGHRRLILLFGVLGDFDSFEYAQSLIDFIPKIIDCDLKLLVLAIADTKSRDKFCKYTKFPIEYIQILEDTALHKSLGLCEGLNFTNSGIMNLLH